MSEWEASGLAILDRAIEELEHRGLNQDGGFATQHPMPGETRKVCTLGALYLGAGMREEDLNYGGGLYQELNRTTPLRDILPRLLSQLDIETDEETDDEDADVTWFIPNWNDDPSTSVEDVILILKQVREEMYAHAVLAS